jgi:hypothetical protein
LDSQDMSTPVATFKVFTEFIRCNQGKHFDLGQWYGDPPDSHSMPQSTYGDRVLAKFASGWRDHSGCVAV